MRRPPAFSPALLIGFRRRRSSSLPFPPLREERERKACRLAFDLICVIRPRSTRVVQPCRSLTFQACISGPRHNTRLRALGMLTEQEIAAMIGITAASVKEWRYRGLLSAHRYNDRGDCLFDPPPTDLPKKNARKRSYLHKQQTIHDCIGGGAV